MSSKARSKATSKATRDRRILAKARREDGKRGKSFAHAGRAHAKRAEKPVSEGIDRAAKRAGLTQAERYDSERVTLLRGDVNLVVAEIKAGFEEILEAEFFTMGAARQPCAERASSAAQCRDGDRCDVGRCAVNAPTTAKPRTESQRLASVLKEEASALNDAIDQVIGSRRETEFGLEDFEKALQTIRSVRLELESEAEKLAAAETAVAS